MKKFSVLVPLVLVTAFFPMFALSADSKDEAITYVIGQRMMFANTDGQFHGEESVSRLDFTLAVVDAFFDQRAADICLKQVAPTPETDYSLLFSDVPKDSWYAARLCVALHAGIVHGNRDGTFRPMDSISAAEAATIAGRAYGLTTGSLGVPNGPWFGNAMMTLSMHGALSSRMDPNHTLTRIEMANMLYALRTVAPTVIVDRFMAPPTDESIMGLPAMPKTAPATIQAQTANGPVQNPVDPCPLITNGSPGLALAIQGRAINRVGLVRHSRRTLRAQAEKNYQEGTFAEPALPKATVPAFKNCGAFFTGSPGAGVLAQGIGIDRTTKERTPTRYLRESAQYRPHLHGIMPTEAF